MTDPCPRELQPRHGLEVAGQQRERARRRAPRAQSSSAAIPGTPCRDRSAGRSGVGAAAFVLAHGVGALVDPPRRDARVEQDRAGDLAVGSAGAVRCRAAPSAASTPCTVIKRSDAARRVGPGRARQQRAVDVEQQQHRTPVSPQRSNEVPGSSRLANAAISLAAASTSVDRRPSRPASACNGSGTETRPVGTPARLRWIASASVPVPAQRLDRERDPLGLAGVVEQLEDAAGAASSRARSPVRSPACAW